MHSSQNRWLIALMGIALGASFLTACGKPAATPPTVTIDAMTKLFTPFVTAVDPGTTITFKNADGAMHDIKTVPNADASTIGVYLNLETIDQSLSGGGTYTHTFTTPGLYDLYDDTQATIDPTYHRVKANAGTAGFPFAPEAVIWVRGNPPGNIPPAVNNSVIAGQDDFRQEFTAIQFHGKLTVHNYDTDKHYATDPGPFSGLNPAQIGNGTNEIDGTNDAPPNGSDYTMTFDLPGLYYYFCTAHADFIQSAGRAEAHKDASVYPMVMESFVLVVQ